MKFLRRYCLLVIAPFLVSCYSSSIIQTAKPLGKGSGSLTMGANVNDYGDFSVDMMGRLGVSDKSDIGFYTNSWFQQFKFDYKHQLLKRGDSFLSGGIGLEYLVGSDDEYDFIYEYSDRVFVQLPLYVSFNHDGKVVPYIGLYYLHPLGLGYNHIRDAGIGLQISFGKGKGKLMLEGSSRNEYFFDDWSFSGDRYNTYQFTIGVTAIISGSDTN